VPRWQVPFWQLSALRAMPPLQLAAWSQPAAGPLGTFWQRLPLQVRQAPQSLLSQQSPSTQALPHWRRPRLAQVTHAPLLHSAGQAGPSAAQPPF
jgi:hypothetical protein